MISYSKLGEYGRLGNQMFQIAATIAHSRKMNEDYVIPDWKYDKYFEGQFNMGKPVNTTPFNEPRFHYSELNHKNIDLVGYYQSDKYFNEYESIIRELFTPKKDILEKFKKSYSFEDSVSFHIRRTDYLGKMDYHPVQSLEYYDEGLKYIRSKKNIKKIYIFSDDIDWCKENIKYENIIFIEGQLDVEDMFLMSLCENNITANSSFSWWSSWLNTNEDKIVIAPEKWFGNIANINTKDLYRNEMIRI